MGLIIVGDLFQPIIAAAQVPRRGPLFDLPPTDRVDRRRGRLAEPCLPASRRFDRCETLPFFFSDGPRRLARMQKWQQYRGCLVATFGRLARIPHNPKQIILRAEITLYARDG